MDIRSIFLLTAKRDKDAARRFLHKAIKSFGVPEEITIDKSGANKAAIESHNEVNGSTIVIRQNKYLKTIIEKLVSRTVIEREADSDLCRNSNQKLAGDYNLMFKGLKFALEVNYGGFFSEEGILRSCDG